MSMMPRALKALVLILPLAFCGGLAANAQSGTGDANDFLSQYSAANPAGRQMLDMLIIGQERGLLTANQFLQIRSKMVMYCPPSDAALSPDQMIVMMRNAVASDGKIGTMPLPVAVLVTLQRNFPCANKGTPGN